MTEAESAYIGRWVTKVLPELGAMAFHHLKAKKVFSDCHDINILFEVFSDYHNINFPECVKYWWQASN